MTRSKQRILGAVVTAGLLAGAACTASPPGDHSAPVPTAPPSTVPQLSSSDAVAMLQQVMSQLEQATTGPDGKPRAPGAEDIHALLQSQADALLDKKPGTDPSKEIR